MTLQDDLVDALVTYFEGLEEPPGGVGVVDFDVEFPAWSPMNGFAFFVSPEVLAAAGPNGATYGYVAADRNPDPASPVLNVLVVGQDETKASALADLVDSAYGAGYTVQAQTSSPIALPDGYYGESLLVTADEAPPEPAPEVPYTLRAQLGPISVELPVTLQATT